MLDFLRSGLTKADLSCFEKTPELRRDKLTIRVIIGAMESMQWDSRMAGTGSNKHVDFGEDKINCLISSTDTGLHDENISGNLSGRDNGFKSIDGSFERRVLILSTKKRKADQLNVL